MTTSGDGGVFPNGIPIGKVVDKRSRDNGLTSEARVQLYANLAALEEVWVIIPGINQTAVAQPAPMLERRASKTQKPNSRTK